MDMQDTPVLLWCDPGAGAAPWRAALAGGGRPVRALDDAAALPQALAADGPAHLVLAGAPAALAGALHALRRHWPDEVPAPLTLLGPLPAPAELARCFAAAGPTGWWPLAPDAPPGLIPAALAADQARWQREQALRSALGRAQTQLDDRRWIDRAKGVLMQARGLSEDEAFRLLRGASMQASLRVGEVSRAVAEAAQWAEAVNRAGQLRMLSQRLVKLGAERLDGLAARHARQAQGMAIGRVQDNLAFLAGLPVMRDDQQPARRALDATTQAWQALKPVLLQRVSPAALREADALADTLLHRAEALTEALEAGGARRALRLVNLCGRQRMRVQRLASQAMLAALLQQPARHTALPALMDEVESTLLELERAPLGSPAARDTLSAAREQWLHLLRGLRLSDDPAGRQALAVAADALLDLFDRLTADYEHSLQLILS